MRKRMSRRSTLRAALFVLLVAILGTAVFTAVAVAGKKKKATAVVVRSSTVSSGKDKQFNVSGDLSSAKACLGSRSMILFETDQNGVITATLATTITGANGTWKMQVGRPTGQHFKLKAKKRVTKKFVCKAGFSPVMQVPNPSHPPKK
jgi:hypothetical protein